MIKDYYTITEIAKLWKVTKQRIFNLIQEGKIPTNGGKPPKIAINTAFTRGHQDLTIWGTPYKDNDQWKIKSRTKDGEQTHKIIEGD